MTFIIAILTGGIASAAPPNVQAVLQTPWSQDLSGKSPIDKHGRTHQPESFCAWMAGGGVKTGPAYGDTDNMG